MKQSQITQWCHEIIRSQAPKGGLYIDATMGKGQDTAFLCQMAQPEGKVLAFDIQVKAIEMTAKFLMERQLADRAELILDGHEKMGKYVKPETVDVICFNFGYLPGADHAIATKAVTSVAAIRQGLELLKHGGMMSLCIYSGGDTGFEEKEAILSYIKELPAKEYTVIKNEYFNRGNHPPMPVFIFKE